MDLIFLQVKQTRYYLLDQIDPDVFATTKDDKWNIEGLFRHILWNTVSPIKYLREDHKTPLVIRTDTAMKQSVGKSKLVNALEAADKHVRSLLDELSDSWLQKTTQTYYGATVTNEHHLFSILCQELEHHG